MYLESLELKNFRCFDTFNIAFPKQVAVIVGNNGAGKSSILEAATVAVGTLPYVMGCSTNYNIKKQDAHYKCFEVGGVIDVQPQFPVEIHAKGFLGGEPLQWSRSLNSAKGRGSLLGAKSLSDKAQQYQQRLQHGDAELVLPIISYYGTGRLWDQHREKKYDAFEKNSRGNGYIDSLDGITNGKLMNKWFQKMTIQQYQREESIPAYSAVCGAMAKCFQLITGIEDVKVQFNLDTNEIDVIYTDENNEKKRIPVNQLSDGYKCTISLIADIAYRMALLNPQLMGAVLEETPGIVLIDEIDLHLHPMWQQRIMSDLVSIFPKVQFIVTTHAPAVINSVKRENLIVLQEYEAIEPSNETYGKDANTILREVMNVSERPVLIREQFDAFYRAIDTQEYSRAEEILSKLNEILGDTDVELVECQVRLELEQM